MARQQFIEEAVLRRAQVRKELESLDVLLADYDEENANLPKLKTAAAHNGHTNGYVHPKGDLSWEDYIVFIIKEIGGKVSSKTITNYAINANPTEKKERIADAVRGKVSKLSGEGEGKRLIAEKTKNRKLGYLYSLVNDVINLG